MSSTLRNFPAVVLLLLLGTANLFADIAITGYTDATNDRFTNSASFIASGFNLSGIGQTDGGTSGTNGKWATAISRNVVISAWHFRPTVGSTVYFYPGNDPSVTPVTRQVVSGIKVGSTDLFLGVLDSALPSSIQHFSYAMEALNGPPGVEVNAGIYQGLNSYMVGKSPFNHTLDPNDDRWSYNDQAVGRNLISSYVENVPFLGNTDNDSLIMLFDSVGSPNHVQYEALLRSGDSGAPFFVDVNGQLRLLGTNAFVLGGNAGSGINYTGNQAQFIADFIAMNVPEPGALWIGVTAALSTVFRRRRSEKRA